MPRLFSSTRYSGTAGCSTSATGGRGWTLRYGPVRCTLTSNRCAIFLGGPCFKKFGREDSVGEDEAILERLLLLRDQVAYLKHERDTLHTFLEYQDNKRLRKAVERSLQVAVEACLDIGRRLIALEGFRYPDNDQAVFRILAEEGIVSRDLLPTLLEMARFRNLIVHDYARIDDSRVYGILKKRLSDFDAFAEAVRVYLEGE
ncbi:MAG TPA: DUF86 domain-containing protein [Anaerolineae bacterium]|nr:DUF86 domain-containing protein [Anaerolineae bacterium]